MAESSLSLTYEDFMEHVARFLGFKDTYADMSDGNRSRADRIVQSAYRQFLNPPIVPPAVTAHKWSFLSPESQIVLASGTADYDAPEAFGSLLGTMTFSTSGNIYTPVILVGEGQIRQERQATEATGYPKWVAIRPKAFSGASATRWEFLFYPEPDGVYTLDYRYNINVNKLNVTNLYPIGGLQHAETMLASCLAAAERDEDETQSVQHVRFLARLQTSVELDLTMGADTLGGEGESHYHQRLHHTHDETEWD